MASGIVKETKDQNNMNRQKIIWILLGVVLASVHETEGSDNTFTIKWDGDLTTDLSLANLVCFYESEPVKVLYHMADGVEYPDSQHEQFAGRAHLDRDALREGRVRLHLSRVTAEDYGGYSCELTANFDKNTQRWGLEATEYFVLNEAQNKDGENAGVSLIKPKSELTAVEGVRSPSRGVQLGVPVYIESTVAPIVLVALIGALLIWATCRSKGDRKQELTEIKTSLDNPPISKLKLVMKRSYLPCVLVQQKTMYREPKLLPV
ncbi:hypothetical protein EXN66_Car013705 [Channa argus]|uniref:Immunoglobulin V-set domain-containing protein n=1 Tax=Channa argus TaxID=215402 RepID=A0A6G1Q6J6_CHAAH|nr:hypothetical protein EXN66_Car013705 [Channa argus]KAK2899681.1 hypothetical protein Q8A73_012810 [Channa argus]